MRQWMNTYNFDETNKRTEIVITKGWLVLTDHNANSQNKLYRQNICATTFTFKIPLRIDKNTHFITGPCECDIQT